MKTSTDPHSISASCVAYAVAVAAALVFFVAWATVLTAMVDDATGERSGGERGASPQFVVAPTKTLPTKRMHFVVDVSGSLAPQIGEVLEAVNALVNPGDDYAMCLTVFSDSPATWAQGWVQCPGPDDLAAAQKLIKDTPHLGTAVVPALALAAKENPKPPKLIVLVTDGHFIYETDAHVIATAAGSKHPILVYGVGDANEPILKALGQLGGGFVR